MKYAIAAPHPVSRNIEIEFSVDGIQGEEILLQLPAWRPGRYELGHFARNIVRWQAFDREGNPLPYKKISRDCWKVNTQNISSLVVRYSYHANQADAGSCWLDEEQLYINPVHCMLFIPDRRHELCEVQFDLPAHYRIATSLKKLSEHVLIAADFDELADSPIIASPGLKHNSFESGMVQFHIWFQGECEPDWEKILPDFRAFVQEQCGMMGDFPFTEFHFLVQALPGKFYHGVEHLKSTVLALGPGTELMSAPLYTDFVGVASHELFHSWNIKTIRPVEMMPYDYGRENYSRLGFVYEGVTTYYGDLFLARCGVYSVDQFFIEMNSRLNKHFHNFGRFNLSVADSSFDTWLDGYLQGAPGRKTSIYDKGCVVALLTDLLIRKNSISRFSLDDVMKTLYRDFGKRGIGYSEFDYMAIIENLCGKPVTDFFMDFVYGLEDDEFLLKEYLEMAGCELKKNPNPLYTERNFGFKTTELNTTSVVTAVVPSAIADRAGLGKDDEIIAVNEIRVEKKLDELCSLHEGQKILLTVSTPMKKLKDISLTPSKTEFYPVYSIRKKEKATPDEQRFFKAWLKQDFYIA